MLTVRFWGVRGSIPVPGPNTVIYGGNTSCIEVRADERLVIVDLGSGVHTLGAWLIENELKSKGKIKADILLSHTHWDHVMGFPMFSPIYSGGTELNIIGPATLESVDLKSAIENQLSSQYWPVQPDRLAAKIKYQQIKETTIDLGSGLTVSSKFLNHSLPCFGYRINYKGKSVVTIFDHELFLTAEENEKVKKFISGADILIHDAQYKQEEYASHKGWGHCTYEQVIEFIAGTDIKTLVFFHHEPSRKDGELEQIEKSYANSTSPKIIVAKEGLVLEA
ncbi:MBL fold metallo-hydrolase [Treponema sp. R80B11-R83G3]